jgi:hypothetical protein
MLAGVGLGLLIFAVLIAFILLFVLDVGLGLMAQDVSEWLTRRRAKDAPKQPWTDRTGT